MRRVIVTVTGGVSQELYDRICQGLSSLAEEEMTFERRNDDAVIGGFVADMGGEIYDASIATQLQKMHKTMQI